MSQHNLTPDQLQALLQYASKRLGTTPEQLAKTVQTGGVEGLQNRLSPEHLAKLQALMNDKEKTQQLINSPKMQQLIQQILNNKK